MRDLHEIYYGKLLNYEGAPEGFSELVMSTLIAGRDRGIQGNIKFFGRMNHKRALKRKADIYNGFKEFVMNVDDMRADNAEYWKNHNNKFNYWKKDVPIR